MFARMTPTAITRKGLRLSFAVAISMGVSWRSEVSFGGAYLPTSHTPEGGFAPIAREISVAALRSETMT